jgi:hypothetical protein
MINSYIKMFPIVFLLLILMANFNGIIPKATAEKYYNNYPSDENIISKIDVVKDDNASNNNSGGAGDGSGNSSSTNSNAKCSVSAPVNTNSSGLKINVLPPKVVMIMRA